VRTSAHFSFGVGLLLALGRIGLFGAELPLPARPKTAPAASALLPKLAALDLAARDQALTTQILSGNVPNFLRKLAPASVTNVLNGVTNELTFFATPDYLAVGSDTDYFLAPLAPYAAQKIAEALQCALPTRKMVDAIYSAARVKLTPQPITPTAAMTTVPVFSNHNFLIYQARTSFTPSLPLGILTAGHKKDVVITPRLTNSPGKVAIYGWHQTNGKPIQPLYLGHTANWVDYSQCTRLIAQNVLLNGKETNLVAVLEDPNLYALLSDEGPLTSPRYRTNPPPTAVSEQANTKIFNEQVVRYTLEPDMKVTVNAPAGKTFSADKDVLLIFFALPNGNTTEQTIGKKMQPGDDWHFDIQHIGAQTRFIRRVLTNQSVVVAYLEAAQKSWPAWRKKNGDAQVPKLLDQVAAPYSTNNAQWMLSGHSGGGSLLFGYLNAVEAIPEKVHRIAFLDSNYAYDAALGHERKLADWLKASTDNYLCVLAYNDAVALLDGKPFVSTAGGTWGRSHAMLADLARDFQFSNATNAEFETSSALHGRIQFLLKTNPERKIFHTVQVERNGFIHAALSGTTNENKGYIYFGERAYSELISE
jgi:hypothetical protein